jgi:hypothetical protein
MALTRPGGYIQAAAPTVTFLNGKGCWTQNQINRYQSTRIWPQQFSTVVALTQGSGTPSLIYSWSGTALGYSTYTAPTGNAYRGAIWDRLGRTYFVATSSNDIKGYEFTKAGGIGAQYSAGTFSYYPAIDTLRASPTSDRLWFYSGDSYGKLCSVPYNTSTKTMGTVVVAVNASLYPYSGEKRPNISPDGNFYGSGNTGGSILYLYAINQSDGSSSGSIATPASVTATAGNIYSVAWSPTGAAIGIGLAAGTPRFRIFRWNSSTYYGSEYSYANFTGGNTTPITKILWNNAGNVIFFLTTTGALQAYQWDDTNGIGSRFADPGSFTWSFGTTANLAISPDDKLLVFNTNAASGSDVAIAWDNTTGFGTISSMPISTTNSNIAAFGTITT